MDQRRPGEVAALARKAINAIGGVKNILTIE